MVLSVNHSESLEGTAVDFTTYMSNCINLFTLMKRRSGVKQGLRNRWFHLQNEIKTGWGDSKNEIGFDVHHVYEQNDIKTRPIMVEQCQNLRNEMKTRWGDSVNLLYGGHRINKSRRSYVDPPQEFWKICHRPQ